MPVLSVDVEAAATGTGHNDRAPVWVAVVDGAGAVLLDRKIRVEGLASPLTAVTGLTAEEIAEGEPFEQVLAEVHGTTWVLPVRAMPVLD